jgi:hypothetical protein
MRTACWCVTAAPPPPLIPLTHTHFPVQLVALDLAQDEAIKGMGSAREAINRVQKLRKKAGLQVRRRPPSPPLTASYRAPWQG